MRRARRRRNYSRVRPFTRLALVVIDLRLGALRHDDLRERSVRLVVLLLPQAVRAGEQAAELVPRPHGTAHALAAGCLVRHRPRGRSALANATRAFQVIFLRARHMELRPVKCGQVMVSIQRF